MKVVNQLSEAADWIEQKFGTDLSVATPLGLGKPNQLLNILYERTRALPSRHLNIYTALSLIIPEPKSLLEKRFLKPFKERHLGPDYPELEYVRAAIQDQLPPNITVNEFYFQAGKAIHHRSLQEQYVSLNYTHVAQSVFERRVPVLVCLIAKNPNGESYSLSCNPDLTLDIVDIYRKRGKRMSVVGVVHPALPFMTEDAEVSGDFFDLIVESDEVRHQLFALPREPVSSADHVIGLQASLLVRDGGTIQIGIGSLSDALIYSMVLRQKQQAQYRRITSELFHNRFSKYPNLQDFHTLPFQVGLYGTSEMVMDAFMHLREAGILKREILDSDEHIRRYLHGAFFLGSKDFYRWMARRREEHDTGLCMTRVSKVNDLYDPHELAIRRQRVHARFFNIAMNATLLGGAASDTLENGQVVSGVGGQYNFVSMAHELADAHSVIMLKSTQERGRDLHSSIVWGHDQLTIPRHLRDVFVTEYGIAFSRGRSDQETIQAIIEIADSRFQPELVDLAKQNGKIPKNYQPQSLSRNRPERIEELLQPFRARGFFGDFPFGSDFTPVEETLVRALGRLKQSLHHPVDIMGYFGEGLKTSPTRYREALERMTLVKTGDMREWFYQKLLLGALSRSAGKSDISNKFPNPDSGASDRKAHPHSVSERLQEDRHKA